ncbi:MAG TPA: aminotransferase class I/II-fold pyridoxal phosphate-dependent enzyme [Salinisphaera sp.]|nr:aminotransferase class I/II-fold pyridoxal phosphate-dependent enzyme [Salinisphaera sp.]HET7313155.1 aminotransferase class I/II-fold pyridoxal phosphate-dependent enzyme [Salinisphaera sp.]
MAVVAVTGATGFIGRATVAALIAAGHRVQALVRSPEAAGTVRALGGVPIRGSLSEPARLAELIHRADALVHAAGQVRGATRRDFDRVNVAGSARLFAAARQAGCAVLALSSLAAREPSLSHYAMSKRTMECLLAEADAPAPAFVLRPPAVYGPGDRELAPLFDAMGRGFAPIPGNPRARVSLIHVHDLAAAIVAWVNAGARAAGIHEIHDGRHGGYSWNDVVSIAESLRGAPIRRVVLPATAMRATAALNTGWARIAGRAPMLTPGKLRELRHADWVADNTSLGGIIDWRPRLELRDGLAATCAWAQAPKDNGSNDEQPLRRYLRPSARIARALRARRGADPAADAVGGRSGSGLGAGDGSAHGTGGSAGRRHSDELSAGRRDHGRSGQGDGCEHRGLSLFDKFEPIVRVRRDIEASGIDPLGVPIERIISATEGVIGGRRMILAGTNNYLGLTFDDDCVEAAVAAVRAQGTGTTGSRMANGSYDGHVALEAELADFYGVGQAIVFSTGYQANLGVLAALAGPRDTIMLDADCHASIYDGLKLGGAKTLLFKHNDPADLDKRLGRLGEAARHTLVVVEGIYSMLGDMAPLAEIVAVVKKHGAAILVDEAHSMGIVGRGGRGVVESAGVMGDVDFVVGTFSKSLGAAGGFCVSRHQQLDMIRYASRPYIFTASPVPSVIASVRAALVRLRDDDSLRGRIWDNARRLHRGLSRAGFTLAAPPGPVVAAVFDSRETALGFWQGLLDRGVYVNLMLPPATPGGKCLIRASLSAAHSREQIDSIVAAFTAIGAPPARAV